jgi:methionine-rich copper-binding protein CopC
MTKTIRMLAAASALTLALGGTAFAHAHLKASTPADGSMLTVPPTEIDITFSEDVTLKFTGIKVTGPDNAAVTTGDGMLMDNDTTLMVPVTGTLAAGRYTVDWHALAKDGHKTSGSFAFTIKP